MCHRIVHLSVHSKLDSIMELLCRACVLFFVLCSGVCVCVISTCTHLSFAILSTPCSCGWSAPSCKSKWLTVSAVSACCDWGFTAWCEHSVCAGFSPWWGMVMCVFFFDAGPLSAFWVHASMQTLFIGGFQILLAHALDFHFCGWVLTLRISVPRAVSFACGFEGPLVLSFKRTCTRKRRGTIIAPCCDRHGPRYLSMHLFRFFFLLVCVCVCSLLPSGNMKEGGGFGN